MFDTNKWLPKCQKKIRNPTPPPPHLGIIPKRQFFGGTSFRQISPFHSSFPWCLFPIFSSPLIPDLFRGRQGDHAGWVGSLIRTSSIFPCLPCPIQRVCPRGKVFTFLAGERMCTFLTFSHCPHKQGYHFTGRPKQTTGLEGPLVWILLRCLSHRGLLFLFYCSPTVFSGPLLSLLLNLVRLVLTPSLVLH